MKTLKDYPSEIYMDVTDYGFDDLELTQSNLESIGYKVWVESKNDFVILAAVLIKIIKIRGVEDD